MYWYNPSGSYLSSTNAAYGSGGSLTTTWAEKGATVTAPTGAGQARVRLYFYNGTGWVAYDDIVLRAENGGGSYGPNLLTNPGFETTGGWTETAWATLGNSTSFWRATWAFAEPKTGSYAYAITNTAYGTLESDEFEVEVSEAYDVSAWIRGEADPDDSRDGWVWQLRVTWYDASHNTISYTVPDGGDPATVPTIWTETGDTVTAPSGAVYAKVQVLFYTPSGWLNVDDISVTSTAGITETNYYNFGGSPIGMRKDGELHWMFTDHLGSTATTYKADGSEAPIRQYYYPWGNLRGSTQPTVPTDVGYTGQRLDTSTDLMFYNARYYDPAIGRFISADTIIPNPTNPQDLNRYAYVRNNPVRYTDPTGHDIDESYGCPGLAYECTSDVKSQHARELWAEWHQMQIWLRQQSRDVAVGGGGVSWRDVGRVIVVIGAGAAEELLAGVCTGVTLGVGAVACQAGAGMVAGAAYDLVTGGDPLDPTARAMDGSVAVAGNAILRRLLGGTTDDLAAATTSTGDGFLDDGARMVDQPLTATAVDMAEDWLGPNARMITNSAGDRIFLSADGTRRIRFDINRPYPHTSPHAHVEELVNGDWVGSGPIYPTDVPHN